MSKPENHSEYHSMTYPITYRWSTASEDQMPNESSATSMDALLRVARITFAAKVRAARAVLGLKQSELGKRAGLTQKSIHRIEQGTDDLRRSTVIAVEQVLKAEGVDFEDLPGGGFKVVVPEAVLAKHERASSRAD
jgi:DNA-binding XRE family transcriptional regulator